MIQDQARFRDVINCTGRRFDRRWRGRLLDPGGNIEEVSRMLFAYVGPETMLPLASILAGAVGVLLMFGRKMVRGVRALAGRR